MDDALADAIAEKVIARLQDQLVNVERHLETLTHKVCQSAARQPDAESSAYRLATPMSIPLPNEDRSAPSLPSEEPLEPLQKHGLSEMLKKLSVKDMSALEAPPIVPSEEEDQARGRSDSWFVATEPERVGVLARCVDSNMFDKASFLVILANSIYVWWVTDDMAKNLSEERPWMQSVETAFLIYYIAEVAVKIQVHRWWFFFNKDWAWNTFDFMIVAMGMFQIFMEYAFDSKRVDVTFLRLCKILRASKILRIFKTVRFIPELRLMATCVAGSFGALFWATLFLSLLLVIAALVFVQSMANFRMSSSCDDELCQLVPSMFGSVASACIVLFQTTTGGRDWLEVYEVVTLSGPLNSALFILYIIFFLFAFFNIVMSIFVDKAMKLAAPDDEALLMEKQETEHKHAKELRSVLTNLDANGSGAITLEELKAAAKSSKVIRKFEMIGITVREVEAFWLTVTSLRRTTEVSISEFVDICMKLKGPASSLDVHAISLQLQEIAHALEYTQTGVAQEFTTPIIKSSV